MLNVNQQKIIIRLYETYARSEFTTPDIIALWPRTPLILRSVRKLQDRGFIRKFGEYWELTDLGATAYEVLTAR